MLVTATTPQPGYQSQHLGADPRIADGGGRAMHLRRTASAREHRPHQQGRGVAANATMTPAIRSDDRRNTASDGICRRQRSSARCTNGTALISLISTGSNERRDGQRPAPW